MSDAQMVELTGGGRVEHLETLGTDLTVVNSARVSFAKESTWELGVSEEAASRQMIPTWRFDLRLPERDRKLIGYLARHDHWTPFSQPQIRLRYRMPLFVARQWFKHTVGFSRNEVSRRYVDSEPEFFFPLFWRERAESVKQGSAAPFAETEAHHQAADLAYLAYRRALDSYHSLLQMGVCPEQARMVLPQAMFTEFVEVGSLAAYARLLRLRDADSVQAETRDYARAVRQLIEPRFPVSVPALLGEETP